MLKRELSGISPKNIKNIAILRLGLNGDLILTEAILPYIAARFPKATIRLIVSEKHLNLLHGGALADDRLIVYKSIDGIRGRAKRYIAYLKQLVFMRKQKHDLFIDLHSRSRAATVLGMVIRSKYKIGFLGNRWRYRIKNLFYSESVPLNLNIHMVENYRNLLEKALVSIHNWEFNYLGSNDAQDLCKYFPEISTSLGNHIVIGMFSSYEAKNWSLENWSRYINWLAAIFPGVRIILPGSPGQHLEIKKVIDLLEPSVQDLAVPYIGPIRNLFLLVRHSKLLVTVDSCFSHIGTICKSTTVTLIEESKFACWHPIGSRSYSIVARYDERYRNQPLLAIDLSILQEATLLAIGAGVVSKRSDRAPVFHCSFPNEKPIRVL